MVSVDASSSSVSPVGQLPPELLIEVFCASEDALAPLTLGTVCRFWKKVVDESPRVWQLVIVDDKRPITASQAQACLWIQRSAPLKLDVRLQVEDPDNILPLLAPFLPVFHRWRQLDISGARQESVCLSNTFSRLDTLNDLSISVCDDEHVDGACRSSFVQYSPLWPNRIAMNVWLTQLSQARMLTPPLPFTSLSITEQSLRFRSPGADPSAVLNLLQLCPQLESFTLSGWMDPSLPVSHHLPIVSLPSLHTVHLRRTTMTRAVLSHIDAPAITKLYLTNLNVTYSISPDYFEPGDSEDEANDYSQSPWSDHATGMGLRRLISRCHPPIKTLEMDFSDMRTKDFVYTFEHLTELEDFLIVASDMSNTVLNLLKPYDDGAPLASQTRSAVSTLPSDEDPCMSPTAPSIKLVRLPHLRNLELYNCNGISGDAIVETLMQRLKYTDRFTPENTLQEIVISSCDQFGAEHRDMVSKKMGSRFSYSA
ncbi:hypothetical protein D9757_003502 [Collybiopsis confluens]|uniref:F-box domain-containing protein n=1 Tax=Collybiopsis confluens TaxID=2823264 RepID=A0A8H5MCZ0_9AGAR|nr:hypothetical protein D9757_003502 [Collybiopsis confluens]